MIHPFHPRTYPFYRTIHPFYPMTHAFHPRIYPFYPTIHPFYPMTHPLYPTIYPDLILPDISLRSTDETFELREREEGRKEGRTI
jgi:hypothetical protein